MSDYKLLTYNLFEGAAKSYDQLVDFIKAKSIDILCLQEVNGWQDNNFERLRDFASQCGFSAYVFGDSNTEFKLATLSRFPIRSHKVYTRGFWHSAVETEIVLGGKSMTIFNVHLNPTSEGRREEEIERLLALKSKEVPMLLTGDFNSLSLRDGYTATLVRNLQAHGITKFGKDKLEFLVTNALEEAGFVDAAPLLDNTDTTVPSLFNKDKDHMVPLRLDYVFASNPILRAVKHVEVIKNSLTDNISDHYPLLVTMRF